MEPAKGPANFSKTSQVLQTYSRVQLPLKVLGCTMELWAEITQILSARILTEK